jgi:hypothetical protein
MAITRRIVLCASGVCSVENSRWPVSAAFIAVSTVSASRSSPMRITSGSCRSAARSPVRKLSVSKPISRCVTELRTSACRNSIGFSSVTMCFSARSFTWRTIAASVVDLPEPVTPVTSTMPRSALAIAASAGRQPELFERRDVDRHQAHDDRERAPLPHDVHAEPPEPRRRPRAVVVRQVVDARAVGLGGSSPTRSRASARG